MIWGVLALFLVQMEIISFTAAYMAIGTVFVMLIVVAARRMK